MSVLKAACRLESKTQRFFSPSQSSGWRRMRNKLLLLAPSAPTTPRFPFGWGPCSRLWLTFLHAAPRLCSICSWGSQQLPVSTSKRCCCSLGLQRKPSPPTSQPYFSPSLHPLTCVTQSFHLCASDLTIALPSRDSSVLRLPWWGDAHLKPCDSCCPFSVWWRIS